MKHSKQSFGSVFRNLGQKHVAAIVVSIVLTIVAIFFVGHMLYRSTNAELELHGQMDVIQSSDRFNAYLIVDKNALMTTGNAVNTMLLNGASTDEILLYLTEQTESMANTVAKSFTGLYGWISGTYLDGAGWVPDADYVAQERPWYRMAVAHPHEIVFVDPYVDMQTGNVMMTIAELLDDGESVIALDIGLEGVQEINDEIAADTPGAIVMVLDNGNVAIAHSDPAEIGADYSSGDSLGSAIVRQLDAQGDTFTVSYQGQAYRVFTKEIEGGWRSISAIDTDVFYRPLFRVTLLTGFFAILGGLLVFAVFYSMSLRELNNRNLGIQIRAAADIYDNLLDIDLTRDTYYELKNSKNPDAAGRLHTRAQETLNQRVERWVVENSKPMLKEFLDLATLKARLSGKNALTVEFIDTQGIWYRGRLICAARQPDGAVTRVLWGTESIDDEKKRQEHLCRLADTDQMTGINNRISGERRITERLGSGKSGMFVLFDVDHFKLFNDRYGHTVGDKVIIAVANSLKNAFRADDIVMRMGGDEFAAFAGGVHTREAAERILQRFYDNLGNTVLDKTVIDKVCVSAGAVLEPEGCAASFRQLYEAADQCMYESKKTPGNHITYHGMGRAE